MVNRPTANGRANDTSALGGYGAFFAPEPETEPTDTTDFPPAESAAAVQQAPAAPEQQAPLPPKPPIPPSPATTTGPTTAAPKQAAAPDLPAWTTPTNSFQQKKVVEPAPATPPQAAPSPTSSATPPPAAAAPPPAAPSQAETAPPQATQITDAAEPYASWSIPVDPSFQQQQAASNIDAEAEPAQAQQTYAEPTYASPASAPAQMFSAPARGEWQSRAEGSELIPTTFVSSAVLGSLDVAGRASLKSTSGVRGALNKVGFKLGLSPAEQKAEERRSRIRRHLLNTYQIAVISVKGGVGRTTVTATLGSTFAGIRADRVVAVDANPDFGDLSTRTSRHPFGLTLRDLAKATDLDAFASVQSFTTTNASDLDVVASAWTTEANVALSGQEYATGIEILRRHYNLLLADCGTGVLDSATGGVLSTTQGVVIVTPATVGGVTGAVATLNWLHSHGLQHLVARAIVAIVQHQPNKPNIDIEAIENLFATAKLNTHMLPYDAHLAEGGEIDLRLLQNETRIAYEELAATLADGFPSYRGGDR